MSFEEYLAISFKAEEEVIVFGLGSNMPGEFKAKIKGIYGMKPYEMYIIEWISDVSKYYMVGEHKDKWPCCVMSKGCLRKD